LAACGTPAPAVAPDTPAPAPPTLTPAPSGPAELETAAAGDDLPQDVIAVRIGRGVANDVAPSSDGHWLAVSSGAGLGLYHLDTFESEWFTPLAWQASDLRWSADGSLIVTRGGCLGCTLATWDAQSGEQVAGVRIDLEGVLTLHVAPSPDGAAVAVLREMEAGLGPGQVLLFEAASGDLLATQPAGQQEPGMAWSPDGTALAIHDREGVVLWTPGGEVRSLAVLETDGVAWSPDGTALAVLAAEEIVVLDAAGAELLRIEEGIISGSLLWPADGAGIVLQSPGATQTWDAESGELLEELLADAAGDAGATAWSRDGKLAAVTDSALVVWDGTAGEAIETPLPGFVGRHVAGVWWMAGGTDLLLSVEASLAEAAGGLCVSAWSAETGDLLRSLDEHDPRAGMQVTWSPDGARLAWPRNDGAVVVDVPTGLQVRELSGHADWALAVDWSPDGSRLATGGQDGDVIVWDTATGAQLDVLAGDLPVFGVYWSPGSDFLASIVSPAKPAYREQVGDLVVWAVSTGEVAFAREGHAPPVAWSPDGTWLLTAVPEGMTMTDAATGEPLQYGGGVDWIADLYSPRWTGALSPNGTLYVHAFVEPGTSGANNFEAVFLESGEVQYSAEARYATVAAWGWSPDGERLAMGGPNFVSIYEAATGRRLATMDLAMGPVTALAWSPDSARIATTSAHGVVAVWDAAVE
jgi:WD40 repeat protein